MAITDKTDDIFVRNLREHLNLAMLEAAEPLIQKALKNIEEEMRKELGKNLIAFMENNYSIQMMGNELVIRVAGGTDGHNR